MNEKFNKNAKVEQLTKVVLSHGEEKGLIVKDPLEIDCYVFLLKVVRLVSYACKALHKQSAVLSNI